jgi:precorrin-2 dehydrogenase/sirohydrochlorin ferrochelatase
LPPSANREYYPVFLDIAGKRCVVIGGGKVAERKCAPLISAGAEVSVISPRISRELGAYKEKGLIRHIRRSYRKGDIDSAFVVIIATDSEKTNRKVAADAASSRVLLNVVDNPSLCNFIVPSVLRRGPLTIAVSTGGVSPAMARAIRHELERRYGPHFSRYLRFLKEIRGRVLKKVGGKGKRERLLKWLASEEVMVILVQKGFGAARKEALSRLEKSGL